MKKMAWLAILLLTTGCANMTPQEKQTAYIVGGIIVAGIIIAASQDSGSSTVDQNCYFTGPGTGRSCDP